MVAKKTAPNFNSEKYYTYIKVQETFLILLNTTNNNAKIQNISYKTWHLSNCEQQKFT